MQYFPRARKAFLALVFSGLVLSAFMLLLTTNTITNVSSVETEGVGVYRDSKCSDSDRVSLIDWETLTPGSVKSKVVYIRNEDKEPIFLIMETTNWDPSKASNYITLRWDYTGRRMSLGEILQITLTLSVARDIAGISSFSFDIVITGSQRLPGDVDEDGHVDVLDMLALLIALTLESTYDDWPACDVNMDGYVNAMDLLRLKMIIICARSNASQWFIEPS